MANEGTPTLSLFPNSTLDTGKQRSVWVAYMIPSERREIREYHQLVQELWLDDGWFKAYFRMSQGQFDNLRSIIGTSITKMITNYRGFIGPAEGLNICLR